MPADPAALRAVVDHPIIFSAPMILALLRGRKTQTRRLAWRDRVQHLRDGGDVVSRIGPSPWQRVQPGDRLWVREAVRGEEFEDGTAGVRYVADGAWSSISNVRDAANDWLRLFTYGGTDPLIGGKTVPSIHMPRWASRITLHVDAVRMERLQDISEADAQAEGADPRLVPPDGGSCPHREGFRALWDTLHGDGAWDRNPELVALTFRVDRRNIDAAS